MIWQEITWNIPLDTRPILLQMDIGVHGPNDIRRYRFEDLWCLHMYGYTGKVLMDGLAFPIQPGYVSLMPPGTLSETHFPELSRHVYAHFAFPSEAGGAVPIRAMFDLGGDFVPILQSFEQALDYFSTQMLRAEVRLWDLLWLLAEKSASTGTPAARYHPAVERALERIEMRLTEPISVAALAEEVGLSHNHLTRLFRAATGTTVTGYIQKRRVQRARHLLIYSTLPIKAIAAEIGLRDLHQFNKLIRRALGEAPRQVRNR
jgi:AraC-like DNA-binding protein